MTWYEKLKFNENPLDARPNSNLVGLEEQEARLINFIRKEEICFLNGPTGSGKTSLLKKVQERVKDHKFIYLDAQDLPSDFNLEREIKNKRSFFDRIRLKKYPSEKPLLLIDEFQTTDPDLILEARSKWDKLDERKIKSIVIAQISRQLRNVSGSFRERLGKRVISLPYSLDNETMEKILRIRLYNKETKINYADRINSEAIDLLVRAADGNVRRLLEFTDILFDYHHRKYEDKNPLLREKYIIPYYVAKNILEGYNVSLTPQTKIGLKTSSLRKMFTRSQQKVVRLLFNLDIGTTKNISERLKMPLPKVQKIINSLKMANAIMITGNKGRLKLWELNPRIKKLMIKK